MALSPFVFTVLTTHQARAQTTAVKTNADDTWQGTLHAGRDLRTVLKIMKTQDGSLKTSFYSIDQGGQPITVETTTFQGGGLKLDVNAIGGTYTGKTQFSVFGVKIPPSSEAPADAPPLLFRAIQEQIGLKLEAGKPMVDVMILDHIERASDN